MIYLLDTKLEKNSHSHFLCDIIRKYTDTKVMLVELDYTLKQEELFSVIEYITEIVTPVDIVLCPWIVPADDDLDKLFSTLSEHCHIVVAAGNYSEPIHKYSPARNPDVITVGTLNKQGLIAALSNFSYKDDKQIKWVPGTNYITEDRCGSGTSISAALYASFLAEAIKKQDYSIVDSYIEEQKRIVFDEISNNDK